MDQVLIRMSAREHIAITEAIVAGTMQHRQQQLTDLMNNNQGSQPGDTYERELRDLQTACHAILNPQR